MDSSVYDRSRRAILTSIPGVSSLTAFALLIAMPEFGALEAGQVANLAGLAPIARQSGRWTGRLFIRGGRADVHQALYMPVLLAVRFSPDMKAKYAHLIETGCPSSDDLRQIAGSRKGGSGSSVIEIMRHAVDAASDGLRLSGA